MLEPLILVLAAGFPAVLAGALAGFLAARRTPDKSPVPSSLQILLAGAAAGAAAAALAENRIIEREYYEAAVSLLGLASCLTVLIRYPSFSGRLAMAGLYAAASGEIVLAAGRSLLFSGGLITTDLVLKVSGFLAGLLATAGYGAILARAGSRLRVPGGWLTGLAAGVFGLLGVRFALNLIRAGLALGAIPLTDLSVNLIAPMINREIWFFYALLGLAAALGLILRRRASLEAGRPPEGKNPAEIRKTRARRLEDRRWATAAWAAASAAVFLAAGQHFLANREVALTAAEPAASQNGEIRIPLAAVDDGGLHRFSFTAADGRTARFLVIRKSEKAYGAAIDGCNLCGPAGYYQSGDQVICKNCGVAINKATFGFPGGCNPVPLKSQSAAGEIILNEEHLLQQSARFQ